MRAPRAFPLWIAVATAVASAAWVMRFRLEGGSYLAVDPHAYFYPKMLYALASLREGGRGLLWNPFQNCGQPFFGISQTGLLYPPYLLFLILDPDLALRAVLFLQLAIGGIGAYLLGRELGVRPTAALAGALAFEMGNAMVGLTISSPTHSAPYAWMPAVLLCCERLLRQPDLRRAAILALVLAVAMLPGMPQTVFFLYQVVILRILWQFATRGVERPSAVLGVALLGLGLPVLLTAVQLLPELEVARQSMRSGSLSAWEITLFGRVDASLFRRQLLTRNLGQPFLPVSCMFAAAALIVPETRRSGIFYGGVALFFFALSFGPGTPVFDAYSHLPGGASFRDPNRFGWVTSFGVAVMTALGFEALMRSWRQGRSAGAAVALMVLPAALLWLAALTAPEAMRREYEQLWHLSLTPSQLVFSAWERGAAILALVAVLIGFRAPRYAHWASAGMLAAIGIQVLGSPPWTSMISLYAEPPPFWATKPVFTALAGSLSAQDRVYLIPDHATKTEFAFMAKTASLVRVPSILDYEPLVTHRYADFSVLMRAGAHARTLEDVLVRGPEPTDGFHQRLLDLTAARYRSSRPASPMRSSRSSRRCARSRCPASSASGRTRTGSHALSMYRGSKSSPMRRYSWSAWPKGTDDLRRVALVEELPASGEVGDGSQPQAATVEFTRNDPEDVVLEVDAPGRGFLVLADQYFPGWFATVNGQPVPIQRANYAFRLVEVPAGRSTIEFHYSPRSLWAGAGVSAVSAITVAVLLWRPSRPRAPTTPPPKSRRRPA